MSENNYIEFFTQTHKIEVFPNDNDSNIKNITSGGIWSNTRCCVNSNTLPTELIWRGIVGIVILFPGY